MKAERTIEYSDNAAPITANNWHNVEKYGAGIRVPKGNKLAYYFQVSDADYWDDLWETKISKERFSAAQNGSLGAHEKIFQKYLPRGQRILEAGCGLGHLVLALRQRGYDCEGVDFGKATIEKVLTWFPDLPLSFADVTALSQEKDSSFHGYISLGVIEHREAGPEPFLSEARRVLHSDGVALISTPHFHSLRRLKALFRCYARARKEKESSYEFYQYAYTERALRKELSEAGFTVLDLNRHNAVKGLSDESGFYRWLSHHPTFGSFVRRITKRSHVLNRLFGHSILLVCRKKESTYQLSEMNALGVLGEEIRKYFPRNAQIYFNPLQSQSIWSVLKITPITVSQELTKETAGVLLCAGTDTFAEQINEVIPQISQDARLVILHSKKYGAQNIKDFLQAKGLVVIDRVNLRARNQSVQELNACATICRLADVIERKKHASVIAAHSAALSRPSPNWALLQKKGIVKRALDNGIVRYYTNIASFDQNLEPVSEKKITSADKGNLGELRELLLEHLPKNGDSLIYDETGAGLIARALRKRGYNVHCLLEDQGATTSLERDPRVTFSCSCGDFDSLDFEAQRYKALIGLGLFNKAPYKSDMILKEAHRVLDNEGTLILSVTYLNLLRYISARASREESTLLGGMVIGTEWSRSHLRKYLSQFGFDVTDSLILEGLTQFQKKFPVAQNILQHVPASLLKKMRSWPFFQYLAGNQLVVVCRKAKR